MPIPPKHTRRPLLAAHAAAVTVAMLVSAASFSSCAGSDGPVVTVDGTEIPQEQFDELHVDVDELDDDERAGSALLLVLREAFVTSASSDLNVEPSADDVANALDVKLERLDARGDIDEVLAAQNTTRERVKIEAELDTIRDQVGAELVRSESEGFDIEAAYLQYSLANAEVCIKQMQLADEADFDVAMSRLDAGEDFDPVARDLSIDPFVGRDEGVGAGGDLGCSPPSALPPGLAEATLEAPLGQPVGPVVSTVGIHLLLVEDRTVDTLDAARDGVLEQAVPVQGPELFNAWAVEVLQNADVVVDDAYGTWGVLPETDPVPTVVPTYRLDDIVDP